MGTRGAIATREREARSARATAPPKPERRGPAPATPLPSVVGNQALLWAAQARPRVGTAGDPWEREAEAAATTSGPPTVTPAPPASSGPPPDLTRSLGAGRPLPSTARSRLESRFGENLGDVRLHTGPAAAATAQAAGARAFTLGRSIVFGAGEYAPRTSRGRRLLTHEVTHTLQQRRGRPILQRQPAGTGATQAPGAAPLSPADNLRFCAERLDTVALPRFQQAVDGVDEAGIKAAGPFVLATWLNLEGSRRQLTAPVSSPARATADAATPLPADLQTTYNNARRAVLVGIGTQKLRDRWVLGSERVPQYDADLSIYILEQTDDVAWVAKDTASLVALLQRDNLPEADQWTAVGLLRQHMNPWNFAYMQAVVADRGLSGRWDRFAEGPRRAHTQLEEAQGQIRMQREVQPGEGMGSLALLPADGKVRLLQPLSPMEVAQLLYGDGEKWQSHLVPYNREALHGVGARSWLALGTELIVEPELLVPRFRGVFLSGLRGRQLARQRGSEPYLWAEPEGPAVVGNTLRFGISWPNAAFDHVDLEWWFENDPAAVREEHVAARVQGPRGVLRWTGESENTTYEGRALAPGNHWVKCRLTHPDGKTEVLSYLQTVMTLEQRTNLAFQRDIPWNRSPQQVLQELRQERDRLGTSSPTRRQELDRRISQIETALQEANQEARQYSGHESHLSPIRAVYVSAEERPMTVPLMVYVDVDHGYFDAPDYHLKLWDFTLQSTRHYTASGRRPQEALRELLRTFADDAPYPKGNMRFEITPFTMGFTGLSRETVTYPTDGGTLWTSVLRGLSMASLAIGVGAAFLGQAEVAVPAFVISGLLAGAAGTFEIWDRLEHGDFAWDLQTGMDILDIAGAVLTAGASSGVTGTVRGVGRMTLREGVQLGVTGTQLGVMAGVHVARINAAVETGDRDQVAQALLRALADGALVLIVHRAGVRLSGEPQRTPDTPGAGGRTMAGTSSGTPPPTPEVIPQPTARPGTPEYHRQVHEAWAAEMMRTGMAPRATPTPPPGAEPLPVGTVREGIPTAQEAYRVYEESLARAPDREVGIFRNTQTGQYAVRTGTGMEVRPPWSGTWETVLHYHPNRANVLTYRMPAPADVQGTVLDAVRARRPITEFVEYPIPGVGRGRAAYTGTPEGRVTIEYQRPDGSTVRRSFGSLAEYQRAYGERTTYLDPSSAEYRWVIEDLNDFYGRGSLPGGRTAGGTARSREGQSAAEVERQAMAESVAHWQEPGQTTPSRFARHQQTFDSIAATLRNAVRDLARAGRQALLPRVNEEVLRMPVDEFIRTHGLQGEWDRMARDARSNPDLRRYMDQFLEGRLGGGGSREVGSRKPDIVEFFLDSGDVIVTDVVFSNDGSYLRVHAFKTDFYRAVIQAMIGGHGGPRVSGLDLNLRAQPIPESRVTP